GYATDTGDLTGAPLQASFTAETQRTLRLRREEIESALSSLRGEIEQTPPMYSAKKIAGNKLYELARRGEEVERKAARVNVHEFETINHDEELLNRNDDGTCDLAVRVVCSAGTYVRALAEDFGRRLGTGAHLAELRRTRVGPFTIEQARSLDQLEAAVVADSLDEAFVSANDAVSHLLDLELSAAENQRVRHG